jgi:hypothetical protein
MSALATVSGSIALDIATLTDRITVDRIEFPISNEPHTFTRFEVYLNTLTFLETEGDGTNCNVYWTKVHTLDATTSTIPTRHEDLVALGASAYAALAQSQYATNRANYGGDNVDRDYKTWGEARLREFLAGCKGATKKLQVNKLIAEDY